MDGVGDNADAFPEDASETLDSDGDGIGDNTDAFPYDRDAKYDSDGDGVADAYDAFPNSGTFSSWLGVMVWLAVLVGACLAGAAFYRRRVGPDEITKTERFEQDLSFLPDHRPLQPPSFAQPTPPPPAPNLAPPTAPPAPAPLSHAGDGAGPDAVGQPFASDTEVSSDEDEEDTTTGWSGLDADWGA